MKLFVHQLIFAAICCQIIYLSSQQYGIDGGSDTVSVSRLSKLGLDAAADTSSKTAGSKSGKTNDIKTKKAAASKMQNQNISND